MATTADDNTSPAPTSKPARKSRVLKRKTDHSLIERRRREKINERLIRLQTLIPACAAEGFDLLRSKPLPKHRRAKKGAGWTEEEMWEKMQKDMVLEKLCIISHTYGECLPCLSEQDSRLTGRFLHRPCPRATRTSRGVRETLQL
jgi:Helix-loop-helix DNA-binding domain